MKKRIAIIVSLSLFAVLACVLVMCKVGRIAVNPSTSDAEVVTAVENGTDETIPVDNADITADEHSELDMEWFISHGGTIVSDDDEDTDTPSATPATTPANGGNNGQGTNSQPTSQPAQTPSGNGQTQQPANTQPTNNGGNNGGNNQPSHTHTFATRTVTDSPAWDEEVVVTPATTERRVVTEAWDEQVPQYGTETRYVTVAGRDVTNLFNQGFSARRDDCVNRDCGCLHGNYDPDCACDSWGTEYVNVITGYTTVHHDAVYETVTVPAVTQTVHHDAVTHTETYCTECGYVR